MINEDLLAYLPMDRRQALADGRELPAKARGAALFADISGFTSLTEVLVDELGPQRGADELTVYLNQVYDALVDELHRWRGSVITFAGDAITGWFDDDGVAGSGVRRAVASALSMQDAMDAFSAIRTPVGSEVSLSMKVALAAGSVSRFLVGDPDVRVMDVIASNTMERLAAAEHEAERGETIVAHCAAEALTESVTFVSTRADHDGRPCYVVGALDQPVAPLPWPMVSADFFDEAEIRAWLVPAVYERLQQGIGEFLAELRPTAALFLRFEGIDYDEDPDADKKLDAYVRWVQTIVDRHQGTMFEIHIGDKGSYFFVDFGAPIMHEDDGARAANTALELLHMPPDISFIDHVQIGLSQGRTRVGPYGGNARRTYGVLGDEVNLAARLMAAAQPDQILASGIFQRELTDEFIWQTLPPIHVKGKSNPIELFALTGASQRPVGRLVRSEPVTPLVGRRAELSKVVEKLERTQSGRGQVIDVIGAPGIGKSRVIAEATRMAQTRGFAAYGGACAANAVNASYHVWQPIWRALFDINFEQSPATLQTALEEKLVAIDPVLRSRVPLLGTVLGISLSDNELTRTFDPKLRKESLENLLADCLRAWAREQPLLLVLEECHWLDALSSDLVQILAYTIVDVPVTLMRSYRTTEMPEERADGLHVLAYHEVIELQDLGPNELRELAVTQLNQLHATDQTRAIPDAFLDQIVQQAEGNPFYLEELTNFIHGRDIDIYDELALTQLQLPSSLHSLVLSRLDQLPESQSTTLKIASIFGRDFRADWLADIYPDLGNRTSLVNDLIGITERGLTIPDTSEPGPTYLFKHVLTQDVIYQSLLHTLKTSVHEQVANYIEQRYVDDLDSFLTILVHHYTRAENSEKQRFYLRRAGEAAQNEYANVAALTYYRELLPLLDRSDQPEILMKMAEVEQLIGNWEDAGAILTQTLDLAEEQGQRSRLPWCRLAAGELCRLQGSYDEATDWFDAAYMAFSELGLSDGLAQVLHQRGTLAAQQGDYDTARRDYERSLEIRRTLDDQDGMARLLNNMAIIALYENDIDAARTLHEEGLAIRRKLGDRAMIANSLNNLANVLVEEDRTTEAQALLEEAIGIQRQIGDRWGMANALNNLGNVARAMEQYEWAETLYAESLQIVRRLGDRWALAYLLEDMGTVAALRGDHARGFGLVGAAQSLRTSIGSPLPPADQEKLDTLLDPLRTQLGAENTERLQQAGTQLNLDAVELALREQHDQRIEFSQ